MFLFSVSCKVFVQVYFITFVMDHTADFYSRPSQEFRGGAFPVFSGSRRQRGGGFFGSIKNFFMPILKKLGKNLLSEATGLVGDVTKDTLMFRDPRTSLKNNARKRLINVGKDAAQDTLEAASKLIGSGNKRRKRRRKSMKTRKRKTTRRAKSRRSTSRKRVSRKRRAKSKLTSRRKAKRRRTNF